MCGSKRTHERFWVLLKVIVFFPDDPAFRLRGTLVQRVEGKRAWNVKWVIPETSGGERRVLQVAVLPCCRTPLLKVSSVVAASPIAAEGSDASSGARTGNTAAAAAAAAGGDGERICCVCNVRFRDWHGRQERDAKQMNDKGIQMMYTQFRHSKSTMTDDDGVTDYGLVVSQPFNGLLGFSNDVVRTMMFNLFPSGTQSKAEFPYYNRSKTNSLLLKYCSRASLRQDDLRWNLNIISVPYFSSQLETDFRQFRESCR